MKKKKPEKTTSKIKAQRVKKAVPQTTVPSIAAAHKVPAVKPLACLLGDEQLVNEYSMAFQEHGIPVIELKTLSSLKTSAKKITIAFELTIAANETKQNNLRALDGSLPASVPIITNSIAETVLAQSAYLTHKERLIGIAAFPTLIENKLVELSPSLYTSQQTADMVSAFFASVKKERAIVEDDIGMVMPRILCQIINEALFTAQNDIGNPRDIDTAMKLGTNYPHGPIEWGEKIGFKNVVAVLDALYHHRHEERYRVAPLLRQMAIAGTFWKKNQ